MQEKIKKILPSFATLSFYTNGQIGPIYEAKSRKGSFIIKTTKAPSCFFELEAKQLQELQKHKLNTPRVFYVNKKFLILEKIENSAIFNEMQAAKEIAKLHSINNEKFGFDYNTLLASFMQENTYSSDFCTFFINQRLKPMFEIANKKVSFSFEMKKAFLKLLEIAPKFCKETITPSLIHGDLWSGNIIFNQKGLFFIDPALYFADKEVELSFIAFFHTFSNNFFREYQKYHKLGSNFWEEKIYFYQLYPILVHIALYGTSYLSSFKNNLSKLLK